MAFKSILFSLIVFFLLFSSTNLYSQEIDVNKETVLVSNGAITEIYKKISKAKEYYPELKNFGRDVMERNDLGIYTLYYRFNEYLSIKRGELYHFGITVNRLGEDNPFAQIGVPIRYKFPILGVQLVAGKTENTDKKKLFDIESFLEFVRIDLWRYEQKLLPYQLTALSMKNTYEVGEPIQVQLELQNMTRSAVKLKDLTSNSLSIEINDNLYGIPSNIVKKLEKADKSKKVILKPQEKTIKRIKFSGFEESGEYKISCSYIDPHKGVFPQSIIRVTVKDDQYSY